MVSPRGRSFRQVILEGMTQELQRQYVSQGRYGALVKTEVKQLPRNRVAVNIDIDEGDVAKIRHINIVGNKTFSEEELLDTFEQNTTGWLSWISSDDKYSREKLSGDLGNSGDLVSGSWLPKVCCRQYSGIYQPG